MDEPPTKQCPTCRGTGVSPRYPLTEVTCRYCNGSGRVVVPNPNNDRECPKCGNYIDNIFEYVENAEVVNIECPSCDAKLLLTVNVVYTLQIAIPPKKKRRSAKQVKPENWDRIV